MTTRRWITLLLAVLLALGLSACQDGKSVMGSLVEVQTDENGDLTALVLERYYDRRYHAHGRRKLS